MALTDKLTAVADAVRGKTGGSSALTLTQMAAEISGKLSGNCFCSVVNVAQNKTSRFAITASDPLLAAHYDDATLWAVFAALDVTDTSASFRRYAFASNSPIANQNGESVYSYGCRDNGTTLSATISKTTMTSGQSSIGVTSEGALTVYANGDYPVAAGDYLVAFGWEEAE